MASGNKGAMDHLVSMEAAGGKEGEGFINVALSGSRIVTHAVGSSRGCSHVASSGQ